MTVFRIKAVNANRGGKFPQRFTRRHMNRLQNGKLSCRQPPTVTAQPPQFTKSRQYRKICGRHSNDILVQPQRKTSCGTTALARGVCSVTSISVAPSSFLRFQIRCHPPTRPKQNFYAGDALVRHNEPDPTPAAVQKRWRIPIATVACSFVLDAVRNWLTCANFAVPRERCPVPIT